jgi:hypothetical protein
VEKTAVSKVAAMTGVAAMIDPLLSSSPRTSMERLELMDPNRLNRRTRPPKRKRAMPARTSKIITAGASATALFSMVAAMGWQSGTGSASSASSADQTSDTTLTAAQVLPVAPPTTSVAAAAVLPPVVTVRLPAATVPTATVPTAPVPVVTVAVVKKHVQVVVPKAVPVATLPVQKVVKHKSHTTTKSSG